MNHEENNMVSNLVRNQEMINSNLPKGVICQRCNSICRIEDNFCKSCGTKLVDDNFIQIPQHRIPVDISKFDKMYNLSDELMLEEFINKELTKLGINERMNRIPNDSLIRLNILNIIFSILLFIYISLIFFHFPIATYVIGFFILFIYFVVTRNYNLIKYLKKQIKMRPNEKISNIIIYENNRLRKNNSNLVLLCGIIISIILPLVLFSTPHIFYEKTDGGYAVRYYVFGVKNFTSAEIPEYYKDGNVVTLRGNTFSNMPFLKSVKLPDSIREIRGQAFKNCISLENVNMPSNLEYLGGGAFYNAKSLKSIELPDTLTYMGGETFYGASSLEYVKLSENLSEIRGDSFEYCTSLKSIIIPDNITRIGGHAFYGDTSLSEVLISENSKLDEIGSSAFRECSSLYNITIPENTYVSERAFKESPTNVERYRSNNNYYFYYNSEYNYYK